MRKQELDEFNKLCEVLRIDNPTLDMLKTYKEYLQARRQNQMTQVKPEYSNAFINKNYLEC